MGDTAEKPRTLPPPPLERGDSVHRTASSACQHCQQFTTGTLAVKCKEKRKHLMPTLQASARVLLDPQPYPARPLDILAEAGSTPRHLTPDSSRLYNNQSEQCSSALSGYSLSDGSKRYDDHDDDSHLTMRSCALPSQSERLPLDPVHPVVDTPGTVLLTLPVHMATLQEAWSRPVSIPPVLKRYKTMYKVSGENDCFLQSQLKPNSSVVHSSSKTKQSQYLAPPDRDGQKIDTLAKRIYAATTIATKMQTYISYMLAYLFNISNTIEGLDLLPIDCRTLALAALQESRGVVRQ
ncbi:UNVERIFIED_CONTAM: hypothetical protein K2H54_064254 [Gekko kuhli]